MSIGTIVDKSEAANVTCARCFGSMQKWECVAKKVGERGGVIRTLHFHEPCFEKHEFANAVYRRGMKMDDVAVLEKGVIGETLTSVLIKLAKATRDLEDVKAGKVEFKFGY